MIDTYHGVVRDFCELAQVEFNPSTKAGDFWKDIAPELLITCCESLGTEYKFDAIIVDEGQDFEELWWTSLEDVFRNPKEKGCYYVFFDPNQNLFVSSPTIPGELGRAFELPMNCRNTVRIAEHCSSLINKTCNVRSGAPLGDEPEMVRVKSVREAFEEAAKRVRKLRMPNAGGLKNYQVAVLAPSSFESEWPKDFGTVKATKNFEQWRQNKGVLIATWTRFKGLEADVVIIIETPSDDSTNEAAHKYVARSRAKHYLTILEVCSR